MKYILRLIFIIISFEIILSIPFEKKVWVYWNSQINQAPLIVQLCHEKFQRIALKNQYQFITLNQNNLHKYISNYQTTFLTIVKNSERKSSQANSDLIRITIIQEHGGIYFDLSTILFNGFNLTWLQNLNDYQNIIINKFGQNPQILFFTYCEYQSSIIQRNNKGLLININPGFQIWFVAAKKKAKLMTEWRNNYYNFTQLGFNIYNKILSDENIFIRNVDIRTSYWSANMALYYTIQKKQIQLDKNISFINLLKQRQNANEYYKIWAIQSQNGPLLSVRQDIFKRQDIYSQTFQQLQKNTGKLLFFLKMNQPFRDIIEEKLNKSINLKANESIYKILQKKQIRYSDCQSINYITHDSLISKQLLQDSQLAKKNNITTIDINMRKKINQKCKIFNRNKHGFFGFLYKQIVVGLYSKIQQVREYNINSEFSLVKILKYNHIIIEHIKLFIIQIILIILFVFCGYKISFQIFTKYKYFQKIIQQNNNIQIQIQNSNQTLFIDQKQNKWLIYFYFFIRLASIIYGLVIFYCIEYFSYTPFISQTIIYLIFMIIQSQIIKRFKKWNNSSFFYSKLNQMIDIPINYFICFSIVSIIQNRAQYKITHSIFISLIGSCVYKIGYRIYQKNKNTNKLLKILISLQGYHKIIATTFYILATVIPNFRFIVVNDRYLMNYFVYIPLIYVELIFIGLLWELIRQKLQMKKKIYIKVKIILIILIIASILLFQVYDKLFTIKKFARNTVYHLSLVFNFCYIYLICSEKIKQKLINYSDQDLHLDLIKNTYNINIIKKQALLTILTFGSLICYFLFGTYNLNYQIYPQLSIHQAWIILINICIYIAWQQFVMKINTNKSQKIQKYTEFQLKKSSQLQ